MQDLNVILNNIIQMFQQQYPERSVTRNWQDRSAYKNSELEPGVLTLVYTGESLIGNAYATHVNLLVIGRVYCGHHAQGLDVEQRELTFLKQWRDFCTSSLVGNISIQRVMTSQQQEVPDGWFICECVAGPFDLGAEIDWLSGGPAEFPDTIHVSQRPDIGLPNQDDYFPVSDLKDE
ncbi:hypothetical protein [Vibrio spartinae]|uniref:Phage protein n=1 Tax=Vibrio spartinae TaxID=1918945 RepID=A0A1N6M5E2_9VIBR|nr:hypothetical protein [Vibrio spartinae]SIO94659.1 hypothetical protein VSP9026_02388 [Vibrio spartinae]